jgi:hypothetical protein
MIEERAWDHSDERILQLQTKIHNYVSFALDGQFAETYPDFVGKPLMIALRCDFEPDKAMSELLADMGRRLQPYKIGFEVKLLPR